MNNETKRLLSNVAANQTGFLVSAVVTFFLSPVVVHSLGDTRYGIWALITSLTGNYGLLAFGVQAATTRFVAHATATNDRARANGYLNAALAFFSCSAALALVVGFLVATYIDRIVVLPAEHVADARFACIVTAFSAAATFGFTPFYSFLIGHQRFSLTNAIGIGMVMARAAATLWLLRHGYGIRSLAVVGLVATAAHGLATGLAVRGLYSWVRVSPAQARRSHLGELARYAYKSFVSSAAMALVYQFDLLVAGTCLAPAYLTLYSLAATLVAYLMQVTNAISGAFGPFTTTLYARGKSDELRSFYVRASTLMYLLGGLMLGGCLAFGRPFFSLWMGPSYSESATILAILVVPQFFGVGWRVGASMLEGIGRIGPSATASLCEGLVNLALSYYLVRKFGLIGVAVGTLIPAVISTGVWGPWYTARIAGVPLGVVVRRFFAPGIAAAMLAAGTAGLLSQIVQPATWVSFLCQVTLAVIATCSICWFVFLRQGPSLGQAKASET